MRSVGVRLVRVRVVHPDDVVPHVLTLDVKDRKVSGPPGKIMKMSGQLTAVQREAKS